MKKGNKNTMLMKLSRTNAIRKKTQCSVQLEKNLWTEGFSFPTEACKFYDVWVEEKERKTSMAPVRFASSAEDDSFSRSALWSKRFRTRLNAACSPAFSSYEAGWLLLLLLLFAVTDRWMGWCACAREMLMEDKFQKADTSNRRSNRCDSNPRREPMASVQKVRHGSPPVRGSKCSQTPNSVLYFSRSNRCLPGRHPSVAMPRRRGRIGSCCRSNRIDGSEVAHYESCENRFLRGAAYKKSLRHIVQVPLGLECYVLHLSQSSLIAEELFSLLDRFSVRLPTVVWTPSHWSGFTSIAIDVIAHGIDDGGAPASTIETNNTRGDSTRSKPIGYPILSMEDREKNRRNHFYPSRWLKVFAGAVISNGWICTSKGLANSLKPTINLSIKKSASYQRLKSIPHIKNPIAKHGALSSRVYQTACNFTCHRRREKRNSHSKRLPPSCVQSLVLVVAIFEMSQWWPRIGIPGRTFVGRYLRQS